MDSQDQRPGKRLVEKKLLESENMFRSIVENSHAGIFIIDGTFHPTYANNMLSEILTYQSPF
jgi:PAS domain-containing protein